MAKAKHTHRLRLYEKADRHESLVNEAFTGTDLEAERRLGEIWNDSVGVTDTYRRYRATARRVGQRFNFITIG